MSIPILLALVAVISLAVNGFLVVVLFGAYRLQVRTEQELWAVYDIAERHFEEIERIRDKIHRELGDEQ